MKKIVSACFLLILASCTTKHNIAKLSDLEAFLSTEKQHLQEELKNNFYWKHKIATDTTTNQHYSSLNASQHRLYKLTGDIKYVKASESFLSTALKQTDTSDIVIIHQAIRNYFNLHRFNDCVPLIKKAEKLDSLKLTTDQLAFDVHSKLRNDVLALDYLNKIKDDEDYNFLIRKGQLLQAKNNLNGAITYLQNSLEKALENQIKERAVWSYLRLGELYEQKQEIEKAYSYFLEALKLQSYNNEALKKIAWVAFSNDQNTQLSNQITDTLLSRSSKPDYLLLKSKILQLSNNDSLAKTFERKYFEEISKPVYGTRYYRDLIHLYIKSDNIDNKRKGLKLAKKNQQTVARTPLNQSWIARALIENKQEERALVLINREVLGHTLEPMALYNASLVIQANNPNDKRLKTIKEQLLDNIYILGPDYIEKINKL